MLILYREGLSKTIGIDDYISDEVWYVSSSINVGRSILGIDIVPKINSTHAIYTAFFDKDKCSREEAQQLVLREVPGAEIVWRRYDKIDVVVFTSPIREHRVVVDLPSTSNCIVDIMPGRAPDHENINYYLNTEHPPLVKLLYAVLMWKYGFKYGLWRVASFLAGSLSLLAISAIVYWLFIRTRPSLWLAALLVVLVDASIYKNQVFLVMSSVGLIDIYMSLFSIASIATLVYGRWRLSAVLFGLALSAKYSALFVAPGILVYLYKKNRAGKILSYSLIVLAVSLLAWSPFIVEKGPSFVAKEVVGAAKWHTTTKSEELPSANPLEMLIGRDSFILYYKDSEPFLVAACNPGVCLGGLVAAIVGLVGWLLLSCTSPSIVGRDELWVGVATIVLTYLGINAGYTALWFAGNKSLYSFYTVHHSVHSIVSLVATILVLDRVIAYTKPRNLVECCKKEVAQKWIATILVATGVLLSPLVTEWPPRILRSYIEEPLAAVIAPAMDRLVALALLAAGVLVYSAFSYNNYSIFISGRNTMGRVAGVATWLLVGLLASVGILSFYVPLLLVVVLGVGSPLWRGFMAGVVSPTPLVASLGAFESREKNKSFYLVGYSIAYVGLLYTVRYFSPGFSMPVEVVAEVVAMVALGYTLSVLLGEELSKIVAPLVSLANPEALLLVIVPWLGTTYAPLLLLVSIIAAKGFIPLWIPPLISLIAYIVKVLYMEASSIYPR